VKLITQRVAGTLIDDGQRVALLVEPGGDPEAGPVVFLAYALTTQGIAAQVVPSLLLDDWGNEVKGLGLYDWIDQQGLRFPRAEVFGLSPAGEKAQYFLRDMELFAPLPAYAALDRALPIAEWQALQAVLVPDPALLAPQAGAVPEGLTGPLRRARVAWWRVPSFVGDLDFLDARPPLE
jgi:hypothetical protein